MIQGVLGDRLRQVAQIPHFPLALRGAVEAGGDNARMLAGPRHFGAFRAVVRTPLRDDAILAGVEETVHLVFRGDAEHVASVAPVEILGKRLAIARHDLVAELAVPHLGSTITRVREIGQALRRSRNSNQVGYRIELHKGNLSVVSCKGQKRLRNRFGRTALRELPKLPIR